MSGVCSAHIHYDRGCGQCNALVPPSTSAFISKHGELPVEIVEEDDDDILSRHMADVTRGHKFTPMTKAPQDDAQIATLSADLEALREKYDAARASLRTAAEALDVRGHMVHYFCALLCGYNDLAKLGQTLEEKTYFRNRRDAAHEELERLGHHVNMVFDTIILTLNVRPPVLRFTAADIELMRKCVADHDAK